MAVRTITINNTDFTDYFAPSGTVVSYKKETGKNEGTMLSGAFTEDILAIKAVVSLETEPLTEAQLTTLLGVITADDYVTVNYFDPRRNDYRQTVMRWEISEMVHRGTGSDGEIWTGLSVTFEDRFDMGA